MQRSPDCGSVEDKRGLRKMGWYRWRCSCCGPKDGQERREYSRTTRRTASAAIFEDFEIGEGKHWVLEWGD